MAQLTKGEWEVSHVDALDEAKGVVYFTSTEKSPMERQLYRVSLDGSGFSRVTTEAGTHSPQFSPDAAYYLDTYSKSGTPPRQDCTAPMPRKLPRSMKILSRSWPTIICLR